MHQLMHPSLHCQSLAAGSCLVIVTVLTFASVTVALDTVYGVAGGKVALPCNITAPTSDDAVSLILWYKEDSTTPIYSLDARKGSLDQARHASSDSLATRSYFSTLGKSAHLLIENILEEDAGEYRCRADFRKARTRNFAVYLKVITPPERPIIRDFNDEPVSSLIGPFNEGDRLTLFCETRGGKPRPSLTWLRESTLLDDTFEVTQNGLVKNTLEVPALQRHDLMAVLTCQASNNNISSPVTSSVTVDLNFRPLVVQIESSNKGPVSADKPVEFTCRSAGSRPPATITWWKGSKGLKKAKETISVDGNVTSSTLSLSPSADDAGKYLSCRAENLLIPGSSIEDGFKLEVNYAPQLSLRLGSKLRHSHIQEGNDVYFDCSVRASPWVTEIRWFFEGKEVHTNTSAGIIVSNQSLVLQRVTRHHRGRYTCSASNSEGEGESNSVHLRVQFAPVCKTSQKILYGAARQESVKIHCTVDADPPEVTFRWAFNSSTEHLELVNHASEGGTSSVATYVPRSEIDYGTLFCWGRNAVGSQADPCVFSVIPAGPPDSVSNCTVTNVTEDSLKVDCSEGYDGGLSQHFIMEVRDSVVQRLRANVTSGKASFTARSLSPGTAFLLVIYSSNAKGRSKAIVLTASTLALPESMNRMAKDSVWQVSFSPILALLVAVVVMLVLVAIIVVAIFKLRTRSPRGKTRGESLALPHILTSGTGSHGGHGHSHQADKSDIPLRKASMEDICTCDLEDSPPDLVHHESSGHNSDHGSVNGRTGGHVLRSNATGHQMLLDESHGELQPVSSSMTGHVLQDEDKESLLGVNGGTRVILVCPPNQSSPYSHPAVHPCLVYSVLPSPVTTATAASMATSTATISRVTAAPDDTHYHSNSAIDQQHQWQHHPPVL